MSKSLTRVRWPHGGNGYDSGSKYSQRNLSLFWVGRSLPNVEVDFPFFIYLLRVCFGRDSRLCHDD